MVISRKKRYKRTTKPLLCASLWAFVPYPQFFSLTARLLSQTSHQSNAGSKWLCIFCIIRFPEANGDNNEERPLWKADYRRLESDFSVGAFVFTNRIFSLEERKNNIRQLKGILIPVFSCKVPENIFITTMIRNVQGHSAHVVGNWTQDK